MMKTFDYQINFVFQVGLYVYNEIQIQFGNLFRLYRSN